jgi:hypothetical protein
LKLARIASGEQVTCNRGLATGSLLPVKTRPVRRSESRALPPEGCDIPPGWRILGPVYPQPSASLAPIDTGPPPLAGQPLDLAWQSASELAHSQCQIVSLCSNAGISTRRFPAARRPRRYALPGRLSAGTRFSAGGSPPSGNRDAGDAPNDSGETAGVSASHTSGGKSCHASSQVATRLGPVS